MTTPKWETSPAYVRMFNDDRPRVLLRKEQVFSNYLVKPIVYALNDRDIRNSDYVLCPLYTYHPASKGKNASGGDFQVGVTGSSGSEEKDPRLAMSREIGEEVGLAPQKLDDMKHIRLSKYEKIVSKYASMEVFVSKVGPKSQNLEGHLVYLTKELVVDMDNSSYNPGKDDRSRKVGCIVYGTEKDIYDYLSQEIIHRFTNSDDLAGVVAYPAGQLRDRFRRG
jgi:hypothetical protein